MRRLRASRFHEELQKGHRLTGSLGGTKRSQPSHGDLDIVGFPLDAHDVIPPGQQSAEHLGTAATVGGEQFPKTCVWKNQLGELLKEPKGLHSGMLISLPFSA